MRHANPDLNLALDLADLADSISLRWFGSAELAATQKPDGTSVTVADTSVERAIRDALSQRRPHQGVYGEEDGGDAGCAARWIVDPIDGTRAYALGIPVWATLLALEVDGVVTTAVISAPALGRRWWAVRGAGAMRNGHPIAVSRVAELSVAAFSAKPVGAVVALSVTGARFAPFGDFWQHALVAEGAVDLAVDGDLQRWDYAAPALVVTEAGGRVSALDGSEPRPGTTFVSSNGLVHDESLAILQSAGRSASVPRRPAQLSDVVPRED